MRHYHYKRLLKLAAHLKSGNLNLDKFDIRVFLSVTTCGTAGCALGECPGLFPKYWKFDRTNPVANRRAIDSFASTFDYAGEFFGLTNGEAVLLFTPGRKLEGYPFERMSGKVRAVDVAMRIEKFVELKRLRKI